MKYSIRQPKTDDIRKALYEEGKHGHYHISGHQLEQQGDEYVELRNIVFRCDKDYIIDASEYDDLRDGTWYERNYEPLITLQLPKAIDKLIADNDTRQAIIQFYDSEMQDRTDMICTMYVSLRLRIMTNTTPVLTYTVHMRSSDVREFRSDLKWHKKVLNLILKDLSEKYQRPVWADPIIWYADSLQCWDKDWEFLK